MNFLSIKNVYMGTYQRVDGSIVSGKSLADLVKAKNAEKNTAVQTLLKSVESSVYAIPVPFDKAISNGDPSKNIEKSILGLRRLSDSIVDAALSLGIQVNADLD
jgi:putative iron-regulated protein